MDAADSHAIPTVAEAMSAPVSRLIGCWLEVNCCDGRYSHYPLQLLLQEHGDQPLAGIVGLLRCWFCKGPPASIRLLELHGQAFCYSDVLGWSVQVQGLNQQQGGKA
jgi:hypothetical protein